MKQNNKLVKKLRIIHDFNVNKNEKIKPERTPG